MKEAFFGLIACMAIFIGAIGLIFIIDRAIHKQIQQIEFKSYRSDSVTFTVQYRGDTLKSFSMHKGKERVYLYLNTK